MSVPRAVITRRFNAISVVPSYRQLLAPALTFSKRIQSGGDSSSVTYEEVALFRDNGSHLVTSAGMTQRVCKLLRASGIQVEFQDQREFRLPAPDFARLSVLREGQDKVILAVAANDGGVVEAPTGAGKSFLIRQICSMWPRERIIIAVPSVVLARQHQRDLLELFPPDEVGIVGAGFREPGARIVVAVDKSLGHCDLDKCGVFIFDEVHRAAAEQTKPYLAAVLNARMYGFSASPYGRADRADLETEAIFGPRICTLDYEEVQRSGGVVPMQVHIVNTGSIRPMSALRGTPLARHGLWRNGDRNALIARAVRWLEDQHGPDMQILIGVQTVDHAVHLGALLPNFQLLYSTMDPNDRAKYEGWKLIPKGAHPLTSRQREDLRLAFRAGTLRKVIATSVWSTGVDFPGLQALIRADGQAGAILNTQWPGRATRAADGKEFGILIDFDDLHHDTLKRRGQVRAASYRKKGWQLQRLELPAGTLV